MEGRLVNDNFCSLPGTTLKVTCGRGGGGGDVLLVMLLSSGSVTTSTRR